MSLLSVLDEYGIHVREKEYSSLLVCDVVGRDPRFTLGLTGTVRHLADCRCCSQGWRSHRRRRGQREGKPAVAAQSASVAP